MAGLVGIVGGAPRLEDFMQGLRLLQHHPSFRSRLYCHNDALLLGATYRDNAPPLDAADPGQGVAVLIYGAPVDRHRGRVIHAERVLRDYQCQGLAAIEALDGGFVVVVLDQRQRRLFLVNDRMATLPVQYRAGKDFFAFAPEAKAVLRGLGAAPKLDATGALEFLDMGYAVGARTLIEDIKLLEPAQVVEVGLDDARAVFRTYWTLRFQPRQDLRSVAKAADEMYEILGGAVANALTPLPGGCDLLMTGGYDSRTLCALLCAQARRPARAISWGISEDIPGSDPVIARQVAARHGVPFQFLRYDHETVADYAESWAFISELGSDNLGNFAAGHQALYALGPMPPVVLNGDQMFGTGGIPVNAADALETASGIPAQGVAPGLAAVLRPDRREQAAERVMAGVRALCASRQGDSAKNIQDYLGYHLRVARWLNAPTYFREPMVSPLRPLLHAPAVEFFQALPETLRVDKRLLVAMLQRRLPHLLEFPIAKSNSLVDWNRAFTAGPGTAEFFWDLALDERLAGSPLAAFIDGEAVQRLFAAYVASAPPPMQREPQRVGRIVELRRAMSRWQWSSLAVRALQRGVRRATGRQLGPSAFRVLQRIALINLLLRTMDCGWFRNGDPWQAGREVIIQSPCMFGVG